MATNPIPPISEEDVEDFSPVLTLDFYLERATTAMRQAIEAMPSHERNDTGLRAVEALRIAEEYMPKTVETLLNAVLDHPEIIDIPLGPLPGADTTLRPALYRAVKWYMAHDLLKPYRTIRERAR